MHLCFTNDSPSLETLSHLPPLPLLIDYSDGIRTMARKYEDNIQLRLRQHGQCVRRVALRAPSSSLYTLLEPMNKLFPRLEDLSLMCTTTGDLSLVLPKKLQAPGLRRLALHGIGLPKQFPLISSTIALSTLSLTHIGAPCYLPPGHLVTQIQGLPHLEELIIGFAVSAIPIPSSEEEPLLAQIPPVALPNLKRLTFRGVGVYIDNLVAQINSPLLERLDLTLFFEPVVTLANLNEFIQRTERFGCPVARVIFDKDGASINADHYKQQSLGKLSLQVNCEPLDWQLDSVTLVCSALGDVLSVVEELTLDLDKDGMPSKWGHTLDNTLWHELLLPFVSVKKLHIGSSLVAKLARALRLEVGGLVLPELQELEVSLKIDLAQIVFSSFIKSRKFMCHPVRLLAPRTLHADKKELPSVTSSVVHSVPRDPSSPGAVVRSTRSLREMVRQVELRLEKERLEQLAIKRDRMGRSHVSRGQLNSIRTDLEWERLVQASLLREYLEWVRWGRLERERLKQEHLKQEHLKQKQEHLEWKRLERACLERARLERARLERARLEQARLKRAYLEQARLEQSRSEQSRSEQAT